MITTNGYKEIEPTEPKKLNLVTTSDEQFEAKKQVERVPQKPDPTKMITTHDEPKKEGKKGK